MQIYLTGFYFFSLKLLNPFYKPTVTNKTVQKKKKKNVQYVQTYNKNVQHKT